MPKTKTQTLAWCAALASFLALFATTFGRLVHDWYTDDNYSHGFIIVPLALYFVWERRDRLRASPHPSLAGLAIVLCGLVLFLIGQLGAELFLPRVSAIVVLAGAVVFIRGWSALRILAFPLAFLLLMVPIPRIVFNEIAFPLQLLASRIGGAGLMLIGIPVLREGNVIVLAHTTLEVAEACSGIRSLISLSTLGILYGYFVDPRATVRSAIALSTIPTAIIANGIRVAGTGIAAHYLGERAAEGFLHTFSGWLMFVVAFGLLIACSQLVLYAAPSGTQDSNGSRELISGVPQ